MRIINIRKFAQKQIIYVYTDDGKAVFAAPPTTEPKEKYRRERKREGTLCTIKIKKNCLYIYRIRIEGRRKRRKRYYDG